MADHVFAPPIDRALARLDLIVSRLAAAKNAANPVPIGPADAEALYAVAFAASEDLCETRSVRAAEE